MHTTKTPKGLIAKFNVYKPKQRDQQQYEIKWLTQWNLKCEGLYQVSWGKTISRREVVQRGEKVILSLGEKGPLPNIMADTHMAGNSQTNHEFYVLVYSILKGWTCLDFATVFTSPNTCCFKAEKVSRCQKYIFRHT